MACSSQKKKDDGLLNVGRGGTSYCQLKTSPRAHSASCPSVTSDALSSFFSFPFCLWAAKLQVKNRLASSSFSAGGYCYQPSFADFLACRLDFSFRIQHMDYLFRPLGLSARLLIQTIRPGSSQSSQTFILTGSRGRERERAMREVLYSYDYEHLKPQMDY
jgi:hypothetical protein